MKVWQIILLVFLAGGGGALYDLIICGDPVPIFPEQQSCSN
ncbi:hypothetical protein Nos7524_1215 [Nostoc sp. PCC 7524]|nr:hypothetical protein [Nostoc sp. PCC 7524]AFY47102.1 hypothetical protein Nos7524_1215 [Nostoc sp. PCC 7524]